MNSNELGVRLIMAAADLMVLVAKGATASEWLPVLQRMAEYKQAWAAALEAEKAMKEATPCEP